MLVACKMDCACYCWLGFILFHSCFSKEARRESRMCDPFCKHPTSYNVAKWQVLIIWHMSSISVLFRMSQVDYDLAWADFYGYAPSIKFLQIILFLVLPISNQSLIAKSVDLLRHPVQSKTVFVMVPDTVLQPDPSARHLQIFDTRKHILNDKCENKLFQI